jgi:hypothetical protein
MRYNGLTRDDVAVILPLLERHSVRHRIAVDEELLAAPEKIPRQVTDRFRDPRRTNALYYLDLEHEEFVRLPEAALRELELLGIVPEIAVAPVQASTPVIESPLAAVRAPQKLTRFDLLLVLLSLVLLAFAALRWVDRYVIRSTLPLFKDAL